MGLALCWDDRRATGCILKVLLAALFATCLAVEGTATLIVLDRA